MNEHDEYGLWYDGMCGGWVLEDLTHAPWAWRGTKAEAEKVADKMERAGSGRPIVKPFSNERRVMPFGGQER